MIVGYVSVGALAGLLASVLALLVGASFWFALGLFTLVGAATLVLLPVTRLLSGRLADQADAPTTADRWYPQGNAPLADPSSDQLVTATETSMRILAVDDDPFILELVPLISAKAGFAEVTPAASGVEALGLLVNSDTIFDCLLLDISMPGMDGIELCRRIRQIPDYHQTPIVMLTAMRDIQNMGDAYRAGATDYATKPFDIEELSTRLRMAQEAVRAQRETGPVRQEGSRYHHRNLIPSHSLELPDELHLQGMESLVDYTALSSYLTQLPRKNVNDVQVFAVSIDGIEAVHTRSSSQRFAALLEDLASVAAGCFEADRTVMAYSDNATLLVATNSVNPLPAINIEIDIERRLQCYETENVPGDGSGTLGVSVVGPVKLQGAKADRARITTDLVIALAGNRSLNKQSRQIAGLSKR